MPVSRSLHRHQLRHRDPHWVSSLARGMNWLCAAIVGGIVMFEAKVAVNLIAPWNVPREVAWLAIVLFGACGLIGLWKLTEPDPAAIEREPMTSPRRLLRWWIVVVIGLQIVQQFIVLRGTSRIGFMLLLVAVWLPGFRMLFRMVGHISRMLPDEALAKEARNVSTGVTVTFGISMTMLILALLPGRLAGPTEFVMALWAPVGLAAMFCGLWAVGLLLRVRKRLRDEARASSLNLESQDSRRAQWSP